MRFPNRGNPLNNSIEDPIISPHISNQLNSEITGINDPENPDVLRTLLPTTQIEINPINVLSKSTNSNQEGEAATTNPNANTFFSNPKSREEIEMARVTKKIGT